MNKKERRLALATALQSAAADMIVVDSLEGAAADRKTKSVVSMFEKVGAGGAGEGLGPKDQWGCGPEPRTTESAASRWCAIGVG